MSIPPFVLPEETFTSIDQVHRKLLVLVYTSSGCNLVKCPKPTDIYFRCARGISTDRQARPCTLSIAARENASDSTWSLRIVFPKHNHPPITHYKPYPYSMLYSVLQGLSGTEARAEVSGSRSGAIASTPPGDSVQPASRRVRSCSISAGEAEETANKRRLQLSPELSANMAQDELDDYQEQEETKPNLDNDSNILILSDSDDDNGDTASSLATFLDSLSSTFKLSKYVDMFQNPEIGIETKAQLLELARMDLEVLMVALKPKMGLGPLQVLRKGLKEAIERES